MTAEVAAAKLKLAAKGLEKNCKDTWKDPEVRDAFKLSIEVLQVLIAIQKAKAAQAAGKTGASLVKPPVTAAIEPARAVFKLKEAVYKLKAYCPELWDDEMRTAFGAAVSVVQKYDASKAAKPSQNTVPKRKTLQNSPAKEQTSDTRPAAPKQQETAPQAKKKPEEPVIPKPHPEPVRDAEKEISDEKPALSIWKPFPESTVHIRFDDPEDPEQKQILTKITDNSANYKVIWNKAYDILDRALHETGSLPDPIVQDEHGNIIRQTRAEINRLAQTEQYAFLGRINKHFKNQTLNDVEAAFRAFLDLRAPYPQKRAKTSQYHNYYIINYIIPDQKKPLVQFVTDETGERKLQIISLGCLSLQNPKEAESIDAIYSSKIGIDADGSCYVSFNRPIKLPPDHATDGLTNACIIQDDEKQIENAVVMTSEDTDAIAKRIEQLFELENGVRSREDPFALETDIEKAEELYTQIKQLRKKYLVMPAETRRAVQDREEAEKQAARSKSKNTDPSEDVKE